MLNDDIARLAQMEKTLIAINERIGKMVPQSPSLYDNMQIAHVYSAQAVRGCQQTVRYLKAAVKEELGG